jgi:hypothetical protein
MKPFILRRWRSLKLVDVVALGLFALYYIGYAFSALTKGLLGSTVEGTALACAYAWPLLGPRWVWFIPSSVSFVTATGYAVLLSPNYEIIDPSGFARKTLWFCALNVAFAVYGFWSGSRRSPQEVETTN